MEEIEEKPATTEAAAEDEVRTLFVSGLPPDVRERELYNLFRVYTGYLDSSIKATGKQPVAFVIFDTKEHCLVAMEALNGHRFDPDSSVLLRIELAKQNSKPKRMRGEKDGVGEDASEKRIRGVHHSPPKMGEPFPYHRGGPPPAGHHHGYYGDLPVWNASPPSLYPLDMNYLGYPPPPGAPPTPPPSSLTPGGGGMMGVMGGGGGGGYRGNPPCSTLFFANLAMHCTEAELRDLCMQFPGYRKMRFLQRDGSPPVAFVEFQDTACSSGALASLVNRVTRWGVLRVEFAKARMGQGAPTPLV